MSIIAYEARCPRCGETFNPAGPDDLEHLATLDGEPCGGAGELLGAWMTDPDDNKEDRDARTPLP